MRTRLPMLVLSLIALVVTLGIAPQTCKATPITVVYNDTPTTFSLSIVGGDFDSDDTHLVDQMGNWRVVINISEDAGFINDVLSINGTAQHIVGPHGEGANVLSFAFALTVDADDFAPGVHTIPVGVTIISHGAHFDQFQGSLTFTVATVGNFDDITGYTFNLIGVHTPTNQPIPEPATLILLGTGLAGVGAAARRRRKMRKIVDP